MESEGVRTTDVTDRQKSYNADQMKPSFSFADGVQQKEVEVVKPSRRFIAEDLNYNPDVVPPLVDLVLKQIIENFPC